MRVAILGIDKGLEQGGRRGLWLAGSLALVGLAAGLIGGERVPPVYEATSRVQPIAYTQQGASVSFDTFDQYARQFVPLMKDMPILQTVIQQLDLPDTPVALAERISVTPDSVFIEELDVTVRDHNAVRAAAIANAIVDAYVAAHAPMPLDSVRRSADMSIRILHTAEVPLEPVEPNLVVDALLGIACGMAMAFASNTLLRRLKTFQPYSGVVSSQAKLVVVVAAVAIVTVAAGLTGARSQPAFALIALAPLGSYLLVTRAEWRLAFVVLGGIAVFQSSQELTSTKVGYLATAFFVVLVSAVRVWRLRTSKEIRGLRLLLAAAPLPIGLVALSFEVAHVNAAGTFAWLRDVAPYAMLGAVPILAVDASASKFGKGTALALLVAAGILCSVAYAGEWLRQRGYGVLPFRVPVLPTVMLPAALLAYSWSKSLYVGLVRWWTLAGLAVAVSLLLSGSRAVLVLVVIPLVLAVLALGRRRPQVKGALNVLALGVLAAAATLAGLMVTSGITVTNKSSSHSSPSPQASGAAIQAPPEYGINTQQVTNRYQDLGKLATSPSKDGSFSERVTEVRLAWRTWIAHPVLGIGPGHLFRWQTASSNAKSDYYLDTGLAVAAKFGLLGLLVICVWLAVLVRFCVGNPRAGETVPGRHALLAFVVAVVAWTIVGNPFEDKGMGFGILLLLVLLEAVSPDLPIEIGSGGDRKRLGGVQ